MLLDAAGGPTVTMNIRASDYDYCSGTVSARNLRVSTSTVASLENRNRSLQRFRNVLLITGHL